MSYSAASVIPKCHPERDEESVKQANVQAYSRKIVSREKEKEKDLHRCKRFRPHALEEPEVGSVDDGEPTPKPSNVPERNYTIRKMVEAMGRTPTPEETDFVSTALSQLSEIIEVMRDENIPVDVWVCHFEKLLLLGYQLHRSRDVADVVAAVAAYGHNFMGNQSMTFMLYKLVDDILGVQPQSWSGEVLQTWDLLTNHPIFPKIGFLLSAGMSMSICSMKSIEWTPFGLKLVHLEALKEQVKAYDFMDAVVRTFCWFSETGWQCFKEKSIAPILYTSQTAREFTTLYDEVKARADAALGGNIADLGEYERKVDRALVLVKQLRSVKSNGTTDIWLQQKYEFLVETKDKLIRKHKYSLLRPAPIGWSISGPTGVGKSTLAKITMRASLEAMGYGYDPTRCINIDEADKYQSTYTTDVMGVYIDDFANIKPQLAATGGDSPSARLIRMFNNVAATAIKAEIEQKGANFFEFLVGVLTTNVKHLNANFFSCCEESILRRFYHVAVTCKQKYRKKDSVSLDTNHPDIVNSPAGALTDIWNVDIEECHAFIGEEGKTQWVFRPAIVFIEGEGYVKCTKLDLPDYVKAIAAISRKHKEAQTRVVNRGDEIDSCTWCKKCDQFEYFCDCEETSTQQEAKPHSLELAKAIASRVAQNTLKSVMKDVVGPWYFLTSIGTWVLGYRSVESMCTSELANELSKGLHEFCIPWGVALLPNAIFTSSTFQRFLSLWASASSLLNLRKWLSRLAIVGFTSQLYALYYKSVGLSLVFAFLQCFLSVFLYAGYVKRKYSIRTRYLTKRDALPEYVRSVRDGFIPNVVLVSSVIAIGVAVLRMWNSNRIKTQALSSPQEVDKSPGWFSSLVSSASFSCKTSPKVEHMAPDQLVASIAPNVWWAVFTRPDGTTTATNVVSLQNGFVLMPEHVFYPGANMANPPSEFLNVVVTRSNKGAGGRFKFKAEFSTWSYRIPDLDMRLVYVPNAGNVSSSWQLLPIENPVGSTSAKFIGRNLEAEMQHDVVHVSMGVRSHSQMSFYGGSYNTKLAQNGACMSAIVSTTKNPCIIGFHIGGNDRGLGVMQTLTQTSYLNAIIQLSKQPGVVYLAQSGMLPEMQMGKKVLESTDVHPNQKFIHALTPDAAVAVLGSVRLRSVQKSEVVLSAISDAVKEVTGVSNKWGPPKLSPNYAAFQATLEHVANPADQFQPSLLERARQDWLAPLKVAMKEYVKHEDFRPLTDKEAIMGVNGKRFLDPLIMSTSMGFPVFGKKSIHFTEIRDDRGTLVDRIPSEAIVTELTRLFACWRRGERAYPICSATLKDEPTTIGKDKVRVFQAAPVAFSLAIRQLFLPVARFLCLHPILSECAVGINSFSRDWNELMLYVHKFAPDRKLLGLDYSKYDVRMNSQVTCAVLISFVDLARIGGYPEVTLGIMEALIADMVHPLLDWNGVLLMAFNMNTSGNNITVNINSAANSLYTRMGFFRVYPTAPAFRDCCAITTYGDDLAGSVDEPWRDFNFLTYKAFLAEHDIKITSPTKTDATTPFLPQEDVDFLKRQSNFVEGVDVPLGKLSEDSIFKSLHCNLRSSKQTPTNVAISCMETALHEWFAYGREHYTMRLEQMKEVAKKCDLPLTPAFCPYDERVDKWHMNYTLGYKQQGKFDSTEGDVDEINPHSLTLDLGTCTDYSMHGCALHVLSFVCFIMSFHIFCLFIFPVLNETPLVGRNDLQIQNCKRGVHPQSGLASDDAKWEIVPHSQEMQQNIMFTDRESGDVDPLEETITVDALRMATYTEPAPLSEFFARPIKIFSLTWPISNVLYPGTSFDPWTLFFENKRVVNRLANYRLLRARLHLKFVINGNAFYYGRMMASYRPLHNVDNTTLMRPGVFADLVQASQRPHIYLNPTTSQGGEMVLPFFWPKNMLDIVYAEWRNLGLVHINGIAPLAHANAGTDPVSISVFAWCEDVEFSVLTSWNAGGIQPQSKELSGIISKPASIVAKVAGSLAVVPQIRPLALATEIGASSIAKMAALFGYSKPTDVDSKPFQPLAKNSLALTDGRESLLKLTVDSQNELSIDPAIADLSPDDELTILSIAKRESLLTQFTWAVGTAPETLLWNIVVDPCVNSQYGTPAELHFPACCFATHPFEYWKGSMKYRFQICSSGYHKGRLKFVYDPVGTSAPAEYNICYTQIVDIAENNDFTIEVGWGQPETWRRHFGFTEVPSQMYSAGALVYNGSTGYALGNHGNGTLSVFVVNDLTVPNSAVPNDVVINVSISVGDDFEVAQPSDYCLTHLGFEPQTIPDTPLAPDFPVDPFVPDIKPQSLEIDRVVSEAPPCLPKMGPDTVTNSALNKIHYGETIASFRTLLKRYNLHEIMYSDEEEFNGTLNVLEFTRTNFPYYPGYTTYTPADSNVIVAAPTGNYAYARMTLLHYLTRAFGAWRGSIRYSLDASCLVTASATDFTNNFSDATISVSRISSSNGEASSEARIMDRLRYADLTTADTAKKSLYDFNAQSEGLSGLARWTTKVNPIGTFEAPFFSSIRFAPGKRGSVFNQADIYQPAFRVSLTMQSGLHPNVIYSYVAAGEDFTTNFFLGAPIFYAQTMPVAV